MLADLVGGLLAHVPGQGLEGVVLVELELADLDIAAVGPEPAD